MRTEERIRTCRVYDLRDIHDGLYVLVDRLWPRGLSKQDLDSVLWLKDLAPSSGLRHWFAHETSRFPEFRNRYLDELDSKTDLAISLLKKSEGRPVILLYAARDRSCNHALVLQDYLVRLAENL